MILIATAKDIALEPSFNSFSDTDLQSLIDSFISAYSLELFNSCSLALIGDGKFFSVIKNIIGSRARNARNVDIFDTN